MTSRRARAYARVTMTLDNLGPAKLLGPEQAQIRHVADTLLFCADIPNDASARSLRNRLTAVTRSLDWIENCVTRKNAGSMPTTVMSVPCSVVTTPS